MASAQVACHACKKPLKADKEHGVAPHALVNISPEIGVGGQTFAYFCECVGNLDDHAGLREKHKLPPLPAKSEKV